MRDFHSKKTELKRRIENLQHILKQPDLPRQKQDRLYSNLVPTFGADTYERKLKQAQEELANLEEEVRREYGE